MEQEKTALLYSFEQNCFHIESLKEYLLSNMKYSITYKSYQGFQLIGIFDSGLDANQWTENYFDWHKREFKPFKIGTLLNNL